MQRQKYKEYTPPQRSLHTKKEIIGGNKNKTRGNPAIAGENVINRIVPQKKRIYKITV